MASQTVWIVGGATGFGAEIAKYYWKRGWNVCISSSDQTKISQFCSDLEDNRPNQFIYGCALDLAHYDRHESIIAKVLAKSQVDLLIVTAAISSAFSPPRPMLQGSLERYQKYLDINAIGPWNLTRSLFSLVNKDQVELSVIYFTSKAAWASTPNFGFYNTSKSLLHHLILNLFSETKHHYPHFKLKMAILEPGEASTEMNKGSTVHPIGILPAIRLIEDSDIYEKVLIVNKEREEKNFTYPV